MTPIFMITRTDGKTDNIYECDFKEGVFLGGAKEYGYDEISSFSLAKEFIMTLAGYKAPKKIVETHQETKKSKTEEEEGE